MELPLFFPVDSTIEVSEWKRRAAEKRECQRAQRSAHKRRVTRNSDPYENGRESGETEAKRMWSGNCADSWENFQNDVDRLLKDCVYKDNRSDNWQDRQFNKGGVAGANKVIKQVEKKCLDNSTEQCDKLASAAAGSIARDFCGTAYSAYHHDSYQKTCRDVAVGECKGGVRTRVKEYCPEKSLRTSNISKLQDKCRKTVDDLLGWNMNLRH